MVTFPVARRIAGVLAAFRVKVTVTPEGILIVVKLKTPLGGSARVVLLVGLKGPSAPVLPLLKVWAVPRVGESSKRLITRRTPRENLRGCIIVPSLPSTSWLCACRPAAEAAKGYR
jgi:hypothetical protein